MIEFVSQIDSIIAACCLFMQPVESRLVPSMLAAGANRKLALVRTFVKMNCAIRTVRLFDQFFYTLNYSQQPLIKG